MPKRLSELKPGETGIIEGFINNDIGIKLLELGFLPGEKVLLEKSAPFGDPLLVYVSGYKLLIRKEEAGQILLAEV